MSADITATDSLPARRGPTVGASAGTRKQRWATTVLGVVLLAEGLGKLLAPAGYFAALARFGPFDTTAAATVGSLWMALEICAGAALLVGGLSDHPPRSIALLGAITALVLQLGYATLSTQAYARGLDIRNCTCFGVYLAQRLSWFVLLQDAYMIFYSSWQVRKISRWRAVTA